MADNMIYHIKQYGRITVTHIDREMISEEDIKEITLKLVKKAKEAIKKSKMVSGAFDVEVCQTNGEVVDSFLSGTY
jgi:hypothetical protein